MVGLGRALQTQRAGRRRQVDAPARAGGRGSRGAGRARRACACPRRLEIPESLSQAVGEGGVLVGRRGSPPALGRQELSRSGPRADERCRGRSRRGAAAVERRAGRSRPRSCARPRASRSSRSGEAPASSAAWTPSGARTAPSSRSTSRACVGCEVDPTSLTARLGPGLRGPQAEAALASHGVTLGHFPQSFEFATIGGFAATRSAGQASAGYGRFDELVSAIEMVSPAGPIKTLGRHTAPQGPPCARSSWAPRARWA